MSLERPDDASAPLLSVVVPCFGCAECLETLFARVDAALSGRGLSFELVLVEDHSARGDWSVIEALARRDPRVRGVKLVRNFGQHPAIAAGLGVARGRYAVVMDCDLQDRPEAIPALYDKALEGYACVFARRIGRADSAARSLASRTYGLIARAWSSSGIDLSIGTFALISRATVEAFLVAYRSGLHFPGLVLWLGFPTAFVDVPDAPRLAGRSGYSFTRLVDVALKGLVQGDRGVLIKPGAFGFLLALAAAVTAVSRAVAAPLTSTPGWCWVLLAVAFLAGLLFVHLAVIGLFISSLVDAVSRMPAYIVERTTFAHRADPSSVAPSGDRAP